MTEDRKISYEPEADVLSVEISREAPIDFAKELGNVVVHFTKHNVPVLIEVLNASQFVTQAARLIGQGKQESDVTSPAGA